jgi:hypothetical protein
VPPAHVLCGCITRNIDGMSAVNLNGYGSQSSVFWHERGTMSVCVRSRLRWSQAVTPDTRQKRMSPFRGTLVLSVATSWVNGR